MVKNANYGRTNESICPNMYYSGCCSNIDCYTSDSKSIVSSLCNGKETCEILFGNANFGDPCFGTEKYLEVEYLCFDGKSVV